jgi:hypothetical protein
MNRHESHASDPSRKALIDVLEEVNDAMPIDNRECPRDSEFVVRMLRSLWSAPFTRETVARADVLELDRLWQKYCGEPKVACEHAGLSHEWEYKTYPFMGNTWECKRCGIIKGSGYTPVGPAAAQE